MADPQDQDTTDDENGEVEGAIPREIWDFELEAFREKLVPDVPGVEQLREINTRFHRLGADEWATLSDLIRQWHTEEQIFRNAKVVADAADHYKGGDIDVSPGGATGPRPDMSSEEFKKAKTTLKELLRPFRGTTIHLLSFYEMHGNPDHVREYLNDVCVSNLDILIRDMGDEFDARAEEMSRDWDWEVEQRRTRALALRDGGLPSWAGYWQLGSGSYGQADLWVKRDASLQIIDRIVVKDSRFKQEIWDDVDLWGEGGPATGIPNEVQAMYSLRGLIGANNVVKIRNYKIDRGNRYHRIMMEFCPFSDPQSLVVAEYIYGGSRRFRDPENAEPADCVFIPEPFLWCIFESLVKVGLLMEQGELERHGMKDWSPIIHRDLKLENILMGNSSRKLFHGYPEIKLADFGSCLLGPLRRPVLITSRGTKANRAPEQWKMQEADEELRPLGAHTNVWGVGMIIYSLLACEYGLQNMELKAQPVRADLNIPDLDPLGRAFYSPELVRLMRRCLAYEPQIRPTFQQLLQDIIRFTDENGQNLARGMRSADAASPQYQVRLRTTEDKWAMHSDLRDVKPPDVGTMPTQPPQHGIGGDQNEKITEGPGGLIPRHDANRKRKEPPDGGDEGRQQAPTTGDDGPQGQAPANPAAPVAPPRKQRCRAKTGKGKVCQNKGLHSAVHGQPRCSRHQ